MRVVLEWRHHGQPDTHVAIFYRSGMQMVADCIEQCMAYATERSQDVFMGWEWHRVTVDDVGPESEEVRSDVQ